MAGVKRQHCRVVRLSGAEEVRGPRGRQGGDKSQRQTTALEGKGIRIEKR